MTVKYSPWGNHQFVDGNGDPASGWKIHTYQAGSATPLATYTDSTGATQQSNPIILDSLGMVTNGQIWLTEGQSYKFILKDASDVVKDTQDYISGVNDSSSVTSQWQASLITPTYVSARSFTMPGDQTSEFHVGRRLQFTTTAGTVYGTIAASAFTSLTTVTMTMDGTQALDSGLSAVSLSILRADHLALPVLVMPGRNRLINGGAEVAQRSAPSLTTSAQYGQVDRCAIWASGGSVSAGTITQTTSATVGRTGKAARAAGTTLTGSGQISWRYRMEAADAVKFKNQAASFQVAVMHDVGSAINYTIVIRKANAADNFAATTVINTGSATSVLSGTATVIYSANVSLGDCSNGLEIEVQAACGAVTTKNFDFTEWQIEEGSSISLFERRDYGAELARCQRYCCVGVVTQRLSAPGTTPMASQSAMYSWPAGAMRASPTITLSSTTGTSITTSSSNSQYLYLEAVPAASGVVAATYLATAEL